MTASTWMIYGANGYTGDLAARVAVERGMKPILAGRRADAIESLANELDLESRVFVLDDPGLAAKGLEGVAAVLHCAGPFSRTSAPMLDACVRAGTHYLDITGEISVFDAVFQQHERWAEAGVAAIPGVGFDVVPSDCLAALLKQELPDASDLKLAFKPRRGKLSPGTTKTVVEGMSQGSSMVRRNGVMTPIPPGSLVETIPFAQGSSLAVAIPWGDVCTAWHSTGIPNITVFMGTSQKQLDQMRWGARLAPLLRLPGVVPFLQGRIAKSVQGPTAAERADDETYLWGEVKNPAGRTVSMALRVPESYTHTVDASLAAIERVLEHPPKGGAYTPSLAFGANFVLDLPGVELTRLLSG